MKRLAAAAVGIVACCLVAMQWEQLSTLKTVAETLRSRLSIPEGRTMTRTTSWRWNDNGTIKVHSVTSTFQEHPFENETKAEFRARHDAKCDADEELYPPIGD